MKSWAELYLERLDELSGLDAGHFRISESGVFPPITVAHYQDHDSAPMQFGFTVGLSAHDHPDWRFGKPELCISIRSTDVRWSLAIGDIADKLKGRCSFCYGEIIRFGCPISDESEMSAFVVFAPSFISKDDLRIPLPDWTVHLAQMYPIYEGEIDLIETGGLKSFLQRPSSFFDDPVSNDLSKPN